MINGQEATKHCRKCNQDKPLEGFYVIGGAYRAPCKECRKADARERLKVDEHYRERSRQRSRDRYHAQLEQDKATKARWRLANRERLLADSRERGRQRYAEKRLEVLRRQKKMRAVARKISRLETATRRADYRANQLSRTEKVCSGCARVLPVEDFSSNRRMADGRQSWCNDCKRLATNARRQQLRASPEGRRKLRAAGLLRNYGLTLEQYDAIWAGQAGLCAACAEALVAGKDHVDHDHRTKLVRAILCGPCNRGLGYILESAERAEGLARYIRAYC